MGDTITIREAVIFSGRSETTIRKLVRTGKLSCDRKVISGRETILLDRDILLNTLSQMYDNPIALQ